MFRLDVLTFDSKQDSNIQSFLFNNSGHELRLSVLIRLVWKEFYIKRLIILSWNPKQPFFNGCLVKQPFPM